MTKRPTQAEVNECIRMADEEQFGADDPTIYMQVLAAEVRALRKTTVDLQYACQNAEQAASARATESDALREERDRVLATLGRIEALCSMNHDDSDVRVGDIRAALRGGS